MSQTTPNEPTEAWQTGLPQKDQVVLARLEWASGKETYAVLKHLEDAVYHTVDDDSSLDYSVTVTHWQTFEPYAPQPPARPAGEQTTCGHPECWGQNECILAAQPLPAGEVVSDLQLLLAEFFPEALTDYSQEAHAITQLYNARFNLAMMELNHPDWCSIHHGKPCNCSIGSAKAAWYAADGGQDE